MIEYAAKNMDSFFSTMPTKYQGPKFDAHIHLGKEKDIKVMLKYTEKFNVKRLMGIVRTTENRDAIAKKFPDIFNFALFVSIREALEGDVKKSVQLLDQAYEDGFKIGKLWFSPRWIDYADAQMISILLIQHWNQSSRNLKIMVLFYYFMLVILI